MTFKVELEREEDGRWIAEVTDLPGVLAYGATQDEAQARVQALALRVASGDTSKPATRGRVKTGHHGGPRPVEVYRGEVSWGKSV